MTARTKGEPVSIKSCSCRRAEGKVRISLTIANQSDRPCFVIPRIRRVVFDRDTGLLSVWFSAGERAAPEAPRVRREFTAPKTEAILERSEKTIVATLPEDMTRLVPHADGTFHLEAIDLTQAREIEIHAAVDDKPFYFSPARTDHLRQVKGWGRSLRARASIEPPTEPGEPVDPGPSKAR